jgi:myo-inositol-1(or 4)-monophosphatase
VNRTENDEITLIREAALDAGKIALEYFHGSNRSWKKSGNSPVSEADIAVDTYLKRRLLDARPDLGWLSEETDDSSDRLDFKDIFIVDPIDGTRGFLAGTPHWCISIAIVSNGVPRYGVLHCPAVQRTFTAQSGMGAWLNGQPIKAVPDNRINTLTGSKELNRTLQKQYGSRFEIVPYVPSLAYRLAMVANGEVDGAFARSGAHEWDLAAADLILRESGGLVTTPEGRPIVYNASDLRVSALVASHGERHEYLLRLAKTGGFLH